MDTDGPLSYEDAVSLNNASQGTPDVSGELSYEDALKLTSPQPASPSAENLEGEKPSTAGVIARSAGRNVAPGILAGEAALTTATALAPTAALTGGIPVIPAVGGGVAALGTYMGAKKLQTMAADKFAPDSFLGTKAEEADAAAHPIASTVGDLLGGGRPSISSAKNIATALGTKAGREGVMKVGKSLFNKEASEKLVSAAKAAPEGVEAKAIENFNHALNAGTGVGLNTGIGIMEGADPLQTAGMGVAGLAFKPWAGRAAGIGGPKTEGQEETALPTADQTGGTTTPEDVIPKTDAEQRALDEQISKMLLEAEAPLTAAAILEKPPVAKSKEAAPIAETTQEPVAESMTVPTPEEPVAVEATPEIPTQQMELPLPESPRAVDPNQTEFNFDPANEPQVSDAAIPQEQQAPQMPTRQQFADAGKALGQLAANRPDARTEFPVGVSAPEATRNPNQLAVAFENVAGTSADAAIPEMSAQDAALSMSKEQFRSWAAERGTNLPVDQIDAFHDRLNPQAETSGNPFDVLAGMGTPESPEVVEPFVREEPLASGYRFMFTTSTDRDAVIDNLVKTGQDGEIRNLNRLMILHGLSDLKGVKVSIEDAQGNYQGDREVSSITSVKVNNPDDLKKVRGRFADIAKISKQKEFLEEKVGEGDASQLDQMDADGFTHVTKSIITIEGLTADQIEQARRASGLLGYTLAKNRIEIYDRDANAAEYKPRIEKFLEALHELGGTAPELTTDVAAIRGYSENPAEYKGTVGYDDPSLLLSDESGKVNRLENPLVKRIFGLMGRAIEPPKGARRSYFDKSDLTKKQVAKQSEIARQYEGLPDNDLDNPIVSEAYRRLNEEILRQYDYLTQDGPEGPGMKFYAQDWEVSGEPYKNSGEVVKDIRSANRMKFLKTSPSSFGPEGVDFSAHPMLEMANRVDANGVPLTYNDLFRAVHDAIAHGLFSVEFGPIGEESAWHTHIRTLNDPMARWALTSETRGQNSWVNYRTQFLDKDGMPLRKGDKGYVPLGDRGFARQKAALLPLENVLTGDRKVDEPVIELQKRLGAEASKGSLAKSSKVSDAAPIGVDEAAKTLSGAEFKTWLNENGYPEMSAVAPAVAARMLKEGKLTAQRLDLMEKFRALSQDQRSKPENAMLALPNPNNIVGWMAEHVGDLQHRMNEKPYLDLLDGDGYHSREGIRVKVRDAMNNVNSPSFGIDLGEVKITPEMAQALKAYADAHRNLKVYNKPQALARDAAVAVGEQKWDVLRQKLSELEALRKDPKKWAEEYYDKANPEGYVEESATVQPETPAPVAESQGTAVAEQQGPETPAEKPSQRLIAASLGISPSRIKAYAARLGRPFESIDEAKAYHAEWEKTKASKTAEDRRAEQGAAMNLSELIDQSVAKAKAYVDQLKGAKLKKYQDLMVQAEEEVNKDFGDSGTDRVVRGKLATLNAAHREVVRQLAINKFSEDLAGFLAGAKKKNPEVVGIGNYLRANVNGKPTGTIPSSIAKVFDVLKKSGWKGEGKYSEASSTKSATEGSTGDPEEIQARFAPEESTEETVGIDREQGVSDADVLRMAQDKVLSSDTPLEDRVLGAALLVRDGSPSPEDVQQIQQMFKAIAEMKEGPEAIRKAQARVHDTTLREFATGEDWETLRSRIGEGEAGEAVENPEIIETMTGKELAQKAIGLTGEGTYERKLAELLSGNNLLHDLNVENWSGLKNQAFGEYVPGSRTIRINAARLQGNTADARTAMHEIIHGLTEACFDPENAKYLSQNQLKAVDNIKALFEEAKSEAIRRGLTSEENIAAFSKEGAELPANASNHYGWTSVHEFMTESLTNKDFQDILKQIKVKEGITGKIKSLFTRLKNELRALLGLPKEDGSALSQAIDNVLELTQSDQRIPMKGQYESRGLRILSDQETPKGLSKRPTVFEIAKWFSDRFGNKMDWKKMTPEHRAELVRNLADEASYAYSMHPEAEGWYDENLSLAKGILQDLDPDLSKPENSFILKAMTAVTSDGNAVDGQFNQAWEIYKNWKKTGKLDPKFAEGDRIKNITGNILMVQHLIDQLGYKGAEEWLSRKGTVKEVREAAVRDLGMTKSEAGKLVGGELIDEVVPYASVFGPKLGSFFNNMNGDYRTVTMDRWFMRTLGRLMGSHLTKPDLMKPRSRFRDAIRALSKDEMQKLGIESKNSLVGDSVDEVSRKTTAYFTDPANRKNLSPEMVEARKAANDLTKKVKGVQEAPGTGSHRRWIRGLMAEVQDQLRAKGINLENADLQAILWYGEKELYGKLNYRERSSSNDYAAAANAIYEREAGGPNGRFTSAAGRVGEVGRSRGNSELGKADGQEGESYQSITDPSGGGKTPEEFADEMELRSPEEQDNTEFNENYKGYALWEARKMSSKLKPNSTKFKKVTHSNSNNLANEYEYLANVDGEPYGLSKYEDPDDPNRTVWAFGKVGQDRMTETPWGDGNEDEVIKLMREDLQVRRAPGQSEKPMASRVQQKPTTAFEEPVKKFSKDLQEAVKDTSYLPFTWKGDANHVSKWINEQATKGSTWESVTLDLTSDAPVAGISERQKMVGKVILTKSLDGKATELKRAGKVAEAARYQKVARTLFESAKIDASLYGQGLNAVKMLSELISGNTVRGQYVDPIAKIHADKLAGKEEVADVLGTVKQGREDGAAATVEKAAKIVERMAGAEGDPEVIKQVIKDALLNPDSTKESLAAELAEATGLPVEKVTPAADAISQTFSSEARKAIKAQLEKLVRNAEKKEAAPKVKKIVESDSDKLLRLAGIGGFSEEKYYNAIAKSFDLPSWDPVFAKSLEVQGEKIAALPESMKDYRQQRTQKLMGEIAKKVRAEKLNNKDVGEIADLMTTFWQLGVLSGPPTQVVNAVASNASIVTESLVEGIGAAVKTGDVRYVADVLHGFLQAVTGKGGSKGIVGQEFARAFKEGTSKFKNSKGETLSAMETLPDAKDLEGLMKAVSVYGNKLKYVGRSMAAFDAANMAMAERAAEMKAARYYLQSRKGFSGKELSAAMRDLFNPDQGTVDKFRAQAQEEAAKGYYEGEDAASQKRWIERRVNELLSQRRDQLTGGGISEQAIQAAERFTYNDDPRGILGQFASWMNQLNQETKVSKFVVSFMKTMMNLVNQTIDWSPYGFLRGANKSFSQTRFKEGSRFDPYRYEEGSPEQYAQYARAAIGTLAWTGLAYLAYKGLEDELSGKAPAFSIHGAGPSNPYDRQQLIATRNWQPNSIRIGDHWVRYTDWPVLGIALGGMGSFFDSQRYAKNDSTTQEKLFAGAMATASTVLDKNMLQGVSNLFDGIRQTNSPAQQANALKRLVSGSVSGFTNPGFAKWARNSFYADKDGMVNRLDQSTNEGWMYSMIPFSAGYDTPALNTLGEPLQMPWYSSTMWRFADISGVPPHEIITPIVKAGMMLPNPSKSTEFHFVDSTGETQKSRVGKYPGINRRFVELRGQAMKEMLTPDVIADLVEMAKENVTDAQAELDSKIGGAARKIAISQIEEELEEGKLRLE